MFIFLEWLMSRLTMKRIELSHVEQCEGKSIYVYEDIFGQRWLAESYFKRRVKTGN